MKQIFLRKNELADFTLVNLLKNAFSLPKDKQRKSRRSDFLYEICCRPSYACKEYYVGNTIQPSSHRIKQHCLSRHNGSDSAGLNYIMFSGCQVDINDVTILDIDKTGLNVKRKNCMYHKKDLF